MYILLAIALVAADATPAVLARGETRVIAIEGDGTWDMTVLRGPEDGNPYGQPRGLALSNDGVLYVSDTFGDRILAFGPDGEPSEIIAWEGLDTPTELWSVGTDTLVVTAIQAGRGRDLQWWAARADGTWAARPLLEAFPALRGAAGDKPLTPVLRKGAWRFMRQDPNSREVTLIEPETGETERLPSKYWDDEDRFWAIGPDRMVEVLNAAGDLIGRFPAEVGMPSRMWGRVYFPVQPVRGREPAPTAVADLICFSPDGTVSRRIDVQLDRTRLRVMSPDGKRLVWVRSGFSGNPGVADGRYRIEVAEGLLR